MSTDVRSDDRQHKMKCQLIDFEWMERKRIKCPTINVAASTSYAPILCRSTAISRQFCNENRLFGFICCKFAIN